MPRERAEELALKKGVKRESLKYNILGLKNKLKRNIFLKFPLGNNALGLPTIVLFVFITT